MKRYKPLMEVIKENKEKRKVDREEINKAISQYKKTIEKYKGRRD